MSKNKNKNKNGSIFLQNSSASFTDVPQNDITIDEVQNPDISTHENQQSLPFDYREKNLANAIAVLAAFFFVLGVGYFAYKYFITSDFGFGSKANEANQITKEAAFTVRPSEDMQDNNEQDNYPNIMNEQQDDSARQEAALEAYDTQAQFKSRNNLSSEKGQYLVWTANDYGKGDIEKGSYTVKEGDTLWEIAEAVYGDGSMWVNILAANANTVDFLANGQQALIYSGQTITIP